MKNPAILAVAAGIAVLLLLGLSRQVAATGRAESSSLVLDPVEISPAPPAENTQPIFPGLAPAGGGPQGR